MLCVQAEAPAEAPIAADALTEAPTDPAPVATEEAAAEEAAPAEEAPAPVPAPITIPPVNVPPVIPSFENALTDDMVSALASYYWFSLPSKARKLAWIKPCKPDHRVRLLSLQAATVANLLQQQQDRERLKKAREEARAGV